MANKTLLSAAIALSLVVGFGSQAHASSSCRNAYECQIQANQQRYAQQMAAYQQQYAQRMAFDRAQIERQIAMGLSHLGGSRPAPRQPVYNSGMPSHHSQAQGTPICIIRDADGVEIDRYYAKCDGRGVK